MPTGLPAWRPASAVIAIRCSTAGCHGSVRCARSVAIRSAAIAAIIAEAAGELGSEETINGVDASSSLLIMALGAGRGDTVEVAGDDQDAVDKTAALVEQDLDA